MKMVKATTALSIAGVLAAGGAAYALNVNVLGPSDASRTSIALQSTSLNTDPASAPVDGNVSIKELSSTATTTTYQVGDAGTVTIDISSGKAVIASVSPNTGWTAEPVQTEASGSAKVHFVSGATRLEFVAAMVDGAPSVSVTVDNAGPRSSAPGINSTKPTMPGSSVGDDDGDGEGRHHDGDHHEDDDGDGHDSEDDD